LVTCTPLEQPTQISVNSAALTGDRLVDPGVTTFRFYITNTSTSKILTITDADLEFLLDSNIYSVPATTIDISGSDGYLEMTPLNYMPKMSPTKIISTFSRNPMTILPLATATLDINIYKLSGSFDTGRKI
jgi:hypothetical protein